MRRTPGGPAARRSSRAGLRRAAAALPAALLLAGCGIQQSDVVDAGAPATLPTHSGMSDGVLLFFRSADGRLLPVPRAFPMSRVTPWASRETAVERALGLLLAGPRPEETALGIDTSLPKAGDVVEVLSRQDEMRVRLSVALAGLDRTALDQLICTTAYAAEGGERTTVRITGRDGGTKSGTCDTRDGVIAPPPSTSATHASPAAQGA